MNFFQKIIAVWQNVSLVQRALLTAIILTFVIVGALLTQWASRPDMGVLYSNLDPEEAAKITEVISGKDIVYKLSNGGTTIYAPKETIAQLRLDMAKEGLPQSGQKGYGIFDNEKIGISPFVQNVNLKRALQDELAKSIQMIEGVNHARVHIVSAEQTLFTSQNSQTSASVVLRIKPGYRIGSLNIAAITHLVAGSVEGLESDSVTVIDSEGHLLSGTSDQFTTGGAGTVADYRERVEQNLANKVKNMLTAVLGPGRVEVQVSAIIDMTSINTVKESYEPKGVPIKEEIKSEKETGAGTTSSDGKTTIPGSTKTGETITTESAIGKTVTQEVVLPGEIKSLTASVVVDLFPNDPNATEPLMAMSDVNEIVRKALGPKLAENDLAVSNARFNRPVEPLADIEESGGLDLIAIVSNASLGIMAICALLVLKIFSGASKKAVAAPAAAAQLPGGGGGAAGLLPGGGEGGGRTVRQQIADSLRNNPEQTKELFASWLEEKGG